MSGAAGARHARGDEPRRTRSSCSARGSRTSGSSCTPAATGSPSSASYRGTRSRALSRGRSPRRSPSRSTSSCSPGWDAVVSIGQVVPHEVVGTAGFTKNLVIGLGGGDYDPPQPLPRRRVRTGDAHGPSPDTGARRDRRRVRPVPGPARERALDPDRHRGHPDGVVLRGLFAGRGGSGSSGGAAYRAAAELAGRCDITVVEHPLDRVVCRLDRGGVPHHLAREQGGVPDAHGPRRRRGARRPRTRRRPLRRGPADRRPDPAARLPRHGRHARRASRPTPSSPRTSGPRRTSSTAAARAASGSRTAPTRRAGGLTAAEVEAVGYGWRSLAGGARPPRRRRGHAHRCAPRPGRRDVLPHRQPGARPLGHGGLALARCARAGRTAGVECVLEGSALAWTQC